MKASHSWKKYTYIACSDQFAIQMYLKMQIYFGLRTSLQSVSSLEIKNSI